MHKVCAKQFRVAPVGDFFLRHLLVVALRADHGGEQAFLAGEGAAVEDQLHQAVGEAERELKFNSRPSTPTVIRPSTEQK